MPSPLGLFIHPEYGLWHGFRGALAFAEILDLADQKTEPVQSACVNCLEKWCLSACPVDAFSGSGYDVPACVGYLDSSAGADCMALGCGARRACPEARAFTYEPAQAAFHMAAFRRSTLLGARGDS